MEQAISGRKPFPLSSETRKYVGPVRHIVRQSASNCTNLTLAQSWPMTFGCENWRTCYSCPRELLRQFSFSTPFCFQVRSSYGTDGQTDGRARPVVLPVRQFVFAHHCRLPLRPCTSLLSVAVNHYTRLWGCRRQVYVCAPPTLTDGSRKRKLAAGRGFFSESDRCMCVLAKLAMNVVRLSLLCKCSQPCSLRCIIMSSVVECQHGGLYWR